VLPDPEKGSSTRQLLFIHDLPVIRGYRLPYYDKRMRGIRLKGRPLLSYFDPDPQHPVDRP
jgi:hypothetical protein